MTEIINHILMHFKIARGSGRAHARTLAAWVHYQFCKELLRGVLKSLHSSGFHFLHLEIEMLGLVNLQNTLPKKILVARTLGIIH